ncbi:MAG: ABC transporter permease [Clostridiales bacterium]|nr:ABC transporter permease [Clostridiales bacterium]
MKRGSLHYLTREGVRSIWVNRLMSVASITVLMACLVIIGSGVLLYYNISAMLDHVESQNVVMVYVRKGTQDTDRSMLGVAIKSMDNVKDCEFIPKEDAFNEQLKNLGDDAALLTGLDASILPDAYRVTLDDMTKFDFTVTELRALEHVEKVRENSDLAGKLTKIRSAVTYISIGMVIMLFLVAVFIIANTVRITMFSRRLEISIMKAVGATNSFIRWPFLIEGVLLGIISGIVSLGVVYGLYTLATVSFAEILSVVGSSPVAFGNYALRLLGLFLIIGVVTGGFGSSVSLGKYLKEQGSVVSDD